MQVLYVERVKQRTHNTDDLALRLFGRLSAREAKAMLLFILLGLFAALALGTYYIGVSIGYLGLALLTMLVIVVLVLATAREDVQ